MKLVGYDTTRRQLFDSDEAEEASPAIESFEVLWGPVSDLPIFRCDGSSSPLDKGARFAVHVTDGNMRAFEVWLRMKQADLRSARDLRDAVPGPVYEPVSIFDRVRARLFN